MSWSWCQLPHFALSLLATPKRPSWVHCPHGRAFPDTGHVNSAYWSWLPFIARYRDQNIKANLDTFRHAFCNIQAHLDINHLCYKHRSLYAYPIWKPHGLPSPRLGLPQRLRASVVWRSPRLRTREISSVTSALPTTLKTKMASAKARPASTSAITQATWTRSSFVASLTAICASW